MSPHNHWYGSIYRKLHLDYHQPPWMPGVAAAITPEVACQQARMFRESGVEAVEIFAHDHHGYCFFPAEPSGQKSGGTRAHVEEIVPVHAIRLHVRTGRRPDRVRTGFLRTPSDYNDRAKTCQV